MRPPIERREVPRRKGEAMMKAPGDGQVRHFFSYPPAQEFLTSLNDPEASISYSAFGWMVTY